MSKDYAIRRLIRCTGGRWLWIVVVVVGIRRFVCVCVGVCVCGGFVVGSSVPSEIKQVTIYTLNINISI